MHQRLSDELLKSLVCTADTECICLFLVYSHQPEVVWCYNSLLSQCSQKLPRKTTSFIGNQSWDTNESFFAGRGICWRALLTETTSNTDDDHLIAAGWWSSNTDAHCSAAPSAIIYWAHIRAAVSSDESWMLQCVCWPRIKVFTRVFPLRVNLLYISLWKQTYKV